MDGYTYTGTLTATYNGKKQSPEVTVTNGNVTASVVVKFAKATEAQNVGEYKFYAEVLKRMVL